jgi:hypothetical protein
MEEKKSPAWFGPIRSRGIASAPPIGSRTHTPEALRCPVSLSFRWALPLPPISLPPPPTATTKAGDAAVAATARGSFSSSSAAAGKLAAGVLVSLLLRSWGSGFRRQASPNPPALRGLRSPIRLCLLCTCLGRTRSPAPRRAAILLALPCWYRGRAVTCYV